MKTIFLASGRSSRMEPLGDKNLLEFCGVPFVLHLLQNAQKGGLKNFIVVTNGENTEEIKNILQKEGFPAQIAIQENLDEGQAGGVIAGLKLVEDGDEVFVLGGNDLVDSSAYQDIFKQSKNADGGILAKKVDQYFPGGYLQISGKNKIESIVEKPGEGNEPSDLVNIVAHFFRSAGDLRVMLQKQTLTQPDAYEKALTKLFAKKTFLAVPYEKIWQAIKYPWHILEIMETLLSQQKASISKKAEISKSAQIKGEGVIIKDGARVFENAVVQGPCYIGENCVVGNNALVRHSILNKNSVAGYNTEIARSFLAQNVTTHMAYVGDSVVDQGVNFGAYSCTANLRLDKKTVKVTIKDERIDSHHEKLGAIVGARAQIGIHSMLMPGAKLLKEELLGPGEIRK
ncbi:NTP transferase domain-containing protein [Candidatus Gracilibacteria bacterium]|nr:NTP transferase domain-containing protein [Candidatus Gracilibacteria bacterium]MCF7819179.1 NTP transferase domain-containing protein [Candidatus Gracilibacteria bacterium]